MEVTLRKFAKGHLIWNLRTLNYVEFIPISYILFSYDSQSSQII